MSKLDGTHQTFANFARIWRHGHLRAEAAIFKEKFRDGACVDHVLEELRNYCLIGRLHLVIFSW